MTPYWGFITDIRKNTKSAEYVSGLKKEKKRYIKVILETVEVPRRLTKALQGTVLEDVSNFSFCREFLLLQVFMNKVGRRFPGIIGIFLTLPRDVGKVS